MSIDWKRAKDVRQALTDLESKEITIQDIIKETKESSTFWLFLSDIDFFKELKKKNLLNDEDIKELFKDLETTTDIDNFNRIYKLSNNLVSEQFELEVIEDLIKRNYINFKEIVYKYKSLSFLGRLLDSENLFKVLIKNNKLTKDDLRYLFDAIDDFLELKYLNRNKVLLRHFVDKNVVSFKELIDKYKSIEDEDDNPYLSELLKNTDLFRELIEDNKITKNDLEYLFDKIDHRYEIDRFDYNESLLCHLINNDVISFKELVDKYKLIKNSDNDPCLWRVLDNKKFFEELIESDKLTNDDLRYLLKKIDNVNELATLCEYNFSLAKKILKEFLLDREDVDRFNTIIETSSWCKDRYIHTIFELIEHYRVNRDSEEVLKLNKLNRCLYDLDFDRIQKLELITILKNNEFARSTLKSIVENNLQDQYKDFEQLKNLLTKEDRKKRGKLNSSKN